MIRKRIPTVMTPRNATMPKTAPAGYRTSYEALLDLLRWGPAVMSLSEFAVMLFHVEQSTLKGWDADLHSQRLSVKGMYRVDLGRWVRGPCGVSKSTWNLANKALAKRGLLKSYERHRPHGGYDATEYEVQWGGLARAFDDWKSRKSAELMLFNLEEKEA